MNSQLNHISMTDPRLVSTPSPAPSGTIPCNKSVDEIVDPGPKLSNPFIKGLGRALEKLEIIKGAHGPCTLNLTSKILGPEQGDSPSGQNKFLSKLGTIKKAAKKYGLQNELQSVEVSRKEQSPVKSLKSLVNSPLMKTLIMLSQKELEDTPIR
jgi:hypothetical protein